jgi:hypothetical protein
MGQVEKGATQGQTWMKIVEDKGNHQPVEVQVPQAALIKREHFDGGPAVMSESKDIALRHLLILVRPTLSDSLSITLDHGITEYHYAAFLPAGIAKLL